MCVSNIFNERSHSLVVGSILTLIGSFLGRKVSQDPRVRKVGFLELVGLQLGLEGPSFLLGQDESYSSGSKELGCPQALTSEILLPSKGREMKPSRSS